ncbi:MAG TPA: HAD family hydrolase [Candidatus Dojkabacteria bacterium]|nr:HAD family hydrolase [Candidatus Dojkabacteria bacterium]
MPNSSKNHFVFDLDDTLVDGRQFCGETIAKVITHFEPNVDFDRVVQLHEDSRGLIIKDLYPLIITELGLSEKLIPKLDEMLAMDKEIQIKDIKQIQIFDGVREILDFLKGNGKKLYMCTNRLKSLLIPILDENNLTSYFEEIISCVDEGYKKPDPTCLNKIISKSEASKDEFIYFGDSEVDSQFAKNAGIEHIIFDQYLNDKNLFKKLINLFLENKINGSEK